MTWNRNGDPATPSKTSAHRDHFAYVRERYGNPLNVQRFWEPPHTDDHAKTLAARLSHVQWIAATVLEGAQSLLTHAQLREEELIENLVKAKNACDETAAPAEAVLAAARLIADLERLYLRVVDPNRTWEFDLIGLVAQATALGVDNAHVLEVLGRAQPHAEVTA